LTPITGADFPPPNKFGEENPKKLMKRPIFKVHGTPEKRRYVYGSMLIILGFLLSLFTPDLIWMALICSGLWFCWHAIRFKNEITPLNWMKHVLFFGSVGTTIGLIVGLIVIIISYLT
jgi:hypothetical protein